VNAVKNITAKTAKDKVVTESRREKRIWLVGERSKNKKAKRTKAKTAKKTVSVCCGAAEWQQKTTQQSRWC
jgi:hypothetical protein